MRHAALIVLVVACGSERPAPESVREPERVVVPERVEQPEPNAPEEVAVEEFAGVDPPRTSLAVGEQFSCALRGDRVWCWGDASDGALGVDGDEARPRPVAVPGVTSVVSVHAARSHAGALHEDGTVTCWGAGGFGRVSGVPTDVARMGPTRVAGITGAAQLALAENHSCVLRRDGSVWCWGRNRHGELGDGEMVEGAYEASAAVRVQGLGAATAIAAFGSRTLAVVGGEVYFWGAGAYRVANRGGSGHIPIVPVSAEELPPRKIRGLRNVKWVVLHRHHGYALTHDGRLFGFGATPTAFGLAGDETPRAQPTQDLSPVTEVTGLGAIVQVVTGAGHTCVRLRDGSLRCWGADPSMPGAGIRGDGQHGYRLPPSTLALDATDIAGGADHLIARSNDRIFAWGTGWAGQLGTGNTESVAVPTEVRFR